jgi:hypothetical protein
LPNKSKNRSVCRVARRWSAKPVTAVRIRYRPPKTAKYMKYQHLAVFL